MVADGPGRLMDEAAKLRQEAAEMEMALREEARSKGVPEEMINKLIPLRNPKGVVPAGSSSDPSAATAAAEAEAAAAAAAESKTPAELRADLGYLPQGDAVRFTQQLDRFRAKGLCKQWNCRPAPTVSSFSVTQTTFKMKTGLEPIQLKLDSAGFNYVNVLGLAVAVATTCALLSSQIGGQVGFLLGYASALFPVLLVGVGSVAPGLIADTLNSITFATNDEERAKHVSANAGKFLCGYVMGLPLVNFRAGAPSNTCEFFQLRPDVKSDFSEGPGGQKMFAKAEYSQVDIARCSVVSIAGPVAECISYKEATGKAAGDVNTLYELMNAVSPALAPDKQQDHIRWSAVTAHDIISSSHKAAYDALCVAFASGAQLEECVAIIEAASAGSAAAAASK